MRRKKPIHELRYFQEIWMVSESPELLFDEKCELIAGFFVQSPQDLKIFFQYQDGSMDEWLFDYLPTKQEAAQIVCARFLGRSL